jgi:transglutaminase-like putative cysteine protease
MDVKTSSGDKTYWRGAIYARYTGQQWKAIEQERLSLIPNRQPPGMANYHLRQTVEQTVTNYISNRQLLVAAPELVMIDRIADAFIDTPTGTELEYSRLFSPVPLAAGEQYVVTSLTSDADATSLRESGSDYPDWIQERYLQLPRQFPDRVRNLAEVITAEEDNNYDRTIALERYLRDTLIYDLNPPPAPQEQDFVDFLLFESHRASCNGYASAMVVMARSLGIPARLAVGYAQGEYDVERDTYRVRAKDAHAWPELFFPQYGWIAFEPTISQTPFSRPEAQEYTLSDTIPQGAGRSDVEEPGVGFEGSGSIDEWTVTPLTRQPHPLLWVVAGVIVTAGVVCIVWWAVQNVGLSGLTSGARNYARLQRFGGWIGHPSMSTETPYEWASGLCEIAPNAQIPIMEIVNGYIAERFAGRSFPAGKAQQAWQRARAGLRQSLLNRLVPVYRQQKASEPPETPEVPGNE